MSMTPKTQTQKSSSSSASWSVLAIASAPGSAGKIFPRGRPAAVRQRSRAFQIRLASAPRSTAAFLIGSGSCCRASSPTTSPAPAATSRSVSSGRKARSCPSASPRKSIGFPRVANNCAICHAGTWRTKEDERRTSSSARRRTRSMCRAAPLSLPQRERSAVQRRHAARRDRSRSPTLRRRPPALPLRHHPVHAKRALQQQKEQFAWMNRPHWPRGAGAATIR